MIDIKIRILNFLLFIIIFLSITSSFANATENETHIGFDPVTISTGDTYYSSLYVLNVTDLVVLALNVSWDTSVINVTDVNTSGMYSDFDSVFISLDTVGGFLDVDAYRFGDEGLSGDVPVLSLSIVAVEPLKDGTTCNLDISDKCVMYDSDQGFIEHSTQSNTITINTHEKHNDLIDNYIIFIVSFIIIIIFISTGVILIKKNKKR